ncbi:MAG: RagB/SusD family nutrient uptake outer membrane protein [Mangrovibacterium sp.]
MWLSLGDKAAMRQLIRNERRLELCFEGTRFWDLRRWQLNLTENAKGVAIDGKYLYDHRR